MPIISQTTWDNMPQEEKDRICKEYSDNIKIINKLGEHNALDIRAVNKEYENLFGKENLQPQLTYVDVVGELFKQHKIDSRILNTDASYKQAEKLLAINKLLNVAKYLNKDWKPDEANVDEFWTLGICKYNDEIEPICVGDNDFRTEIVYFRTEELAKQAVAILGKDVIRLALGNY